MKKHKVCELEGALLDAAVAKAEGGFALRSDGTGYVFEQGRVMERCIGDRGYYRQAFEPSSNCCHGDPIIDREQIATWGSDDGWGAEHPANPEGYYSLERGILDTSMMRLPTGADRLTAAMRVYVASKFGEWVEI